MMDTTEDLGEDIPPIDLTDAVREAVHDGLFITWARPGGYSSPEVRPTIPTGFIQKGLKAVPDGWAKIHGQWVELEPSTLDQRPGQLWRVKEPQASQILERLSR